MELSWPTGGCRQLRLSKPPSTAYSHTSASHWAAVSPLPWTNLSASGVFSLGEVANFRERHASVCTEERPQFSLENMQLIYIEDAVLSAMKAGQELPPAPELTGAHGLISAWVRAEAHCLFLQL